MRVPPLLGLCCILLGVGLALLSLPTHRGNPPLARAFTVDGVSFREVPMRVFHQDVAYLVQVRIEARGQVGLRVVTAPRPEQVGMLLGSWRFSGDANADRGVLQGVREALMGILRTVARRGAPGREAA